MSEFGDLLQRLRRERGLTQSSLAEAAECDKDTVAKVEHGRAANWRPGTARRIYDALSAAAPLTLAEARAFAHATGLTLPTASNPARAHPPAPHPPTAESLQLSRLHRLLDHIVAVAGVQPVAAALAALSAALHVEERLASGEGEEFFVRYPAVQKQGFYEYTEKTYVRKPDAPPKPQRRSGT
jgi:transcriptional regulator with XRE-family HTH domain